ncbi:hypothetical protein BH09PAT2_BH09PAT2_03960 [soil metagenome]
MIELGNSPEILRSQYPDGVIMYHQGYKELANTVLSQFAKQLPGYLPIIKGFDSQYLFAEDWVTDRGGQIGNILYGDISFYDCLLDGISSQTGIKRQEIEPLLPPMIYEERIGRNVAINGYNVPIGGTSLVFQGITDPFTTEIYNQQDIRLLPLDSLRQAIHEDKQQSAGGGIQLLSAHIDLAITGFRTGDHLSIYLDEKYGYLGEEIIRILADNNAILETIPHDLAKKGALNIRYIDNKAVIPSCKVLGPIASRLIAHDYELVELGEDQMLDGGGVKCRMIPISWR